MRIYSDADRIPPPPPAGGGWCTPPFRPGRGRRRAGLARLLMQPGTLRRQRDERLVAGVAGAVAARVGADPTVVRVVMVITVLFGGLGLALYMAAWLVIPLEGEGEAPGRRALADRRGLALAVGVFSLVEALLIVVSELGLHAPHGVGWPCSLAVGGLVLVWRNASSDDLQALRRIGTYLGALPGARSRRATVGRVVFGVLLLVAGGAGLFGITRHSGATTSALIGAGAMAAGFVIVFGPWWLRLARDLAAERRERVRADERAEVAAHLHDSVLQTLALIQRSASNPREVTRLARAQERELRSWLFGDRVPAAAGDAATFSAVLDQMGSDVELRHGVAVETVVVGDAPLDDDLGAVVAATREAAVNSAKWSGEAAVSVFAEVEPDRVSVFVRDRGAGFDPDQVAADRRGIRESIHGRIDRRGGKTVLRSAPGAGTEVEIVMPRRQP